MITTNARGEFVNLSNTGNINVIPNLTNITNLNNIQGNNFASNGKIENLNIMVVKDLIKKNSGLDNIKPLQISEGKVRSILGYIELPLIPRKII